MSTSPSDCADGLTATTVSTGSLKRKKSRWSQAQKKQQKESFSNLSLTKIQQILNSAAKAQLTNSVRIRRERQINNAATSQENLRVVTSCVLDSDDSSPVTIPTIYVQPLLILDLNGILCHRIRRNRTPLVNQSAYRPTIGRIIARTPVVPRPKLAEFLDYLDTHFCLAIWTSAKAKTANELIQALLPGRIAARLLFVWAQDQCLVDPSTASLAPHEVVYQKKLGKVWEHFPLWNTHNTLMIDDSPDKITGHDSRNAWHPVPLHGRRDLQLSHETLPLVADEENVEKQFMFFRSLVEYWQHNPVIVEWNSRADSQQYQRPSSIQGEGHLDFVQAFRDST
jgi:RNA polymerase II subunit A small phosphatase-like protein